MTHNRTHRTLRRILNLGVWVHLIRVMLQSGICNRTNIRTRVGNWVVRWKNRRDRAHNRTDVLVQLFVRGRVDGLSERRARFGTKVGVSGDAGVLVQDMVVVGRGSGDGTDQAWRVHVEVWVGGRKDGVGCADDGADLLCGGGHDFVGCSGAESR
jgi:hypothetical protein